MNEKQLHALAAEFAKNLKTAQHINFPLNLGKFDKAVKIVHHFSINIVNTISMSYLNFI
ncbi:hypothetical protein GHI55_00015 [Glaesserella parasuis]|nr:hypothetical protein [Glaesserella parasuis]